MACDASIREDLLSRLANQPSYIMAGMIKISNPATASTIARTSDASSFLGRLDVLPLEILHYTLSMLDLRTLSSISQACLRGVAVIKSMPEYRDLIRYAPSTMTALGLTSLIEYHSAYDLHIALLASECASCGEFGPFLFLPTCERCCYGCLWSNQALWVVPISLARDYFELSAASVKKLPTMRSFPGTYWVRHEITRRRQLRLVSVKAAKELALGEGKTVRALTQNLEDKRAGGGLKDYYMRACLQNAPLVPPGQAIIEKRLGVPCIPTDKFCGMASIPFSSLLVRGQPEMGLWCLGCAKVQREDSSLRRYKVSIDLEARGYHASNALHNMTQIARSEAELFEHIAQCEGAKELVPDLEEKLRQMTLA